MSDHTWSPIGRSIQLCLLKNSFNFWFNYLDTDIIERSLRDILAVTNEYDDGMIAIQPYQPFQRMVSLSSFVPAQVQGFVS